ncbi:hypothetical protein BH09DEP1_BH09DEP1_0170 [soil metagenome]
MKKYLFPAHYFFLGFILAFAATAQECQNKYAWQTDDSQLITNLSDKFLPPARIPEKPVEESTAQLKKIVSSWRPPAQQPKAKATQSAKENKKQADNYLKEQHQLARAGKFDREAWLNTLLKWHPDKIAFLVENPVLDEFIENRWEKRDCKTLYVLATLLDKAGRIQPSTERLTYTQYQNERRLETKSLDIINKIQTLPYVNNMITGNIESHLDFLRKNDPRLIDYYDSISNKFAGNQVVFPRLGWLPNNTGLRALEPQTHIAPLIEPTVKSSQPIIKTETQKLKLAAPEKLIDTPKTIATAVLHKPTPAITIIATVPSAPDNQPVDIHQLIAAYKKASTTGNYQTALDKAWQVTKHTTPQSSEYKRAAARIDFISRLDLQKNKPAKEAVAGALYRQTLLHQSDANPSQAISYFMKAQNLREGILVEEPDETDPITFTALTNTILSVTNTSDQEIKDTIDFITTLAGQGNQQAIQAIASYHHKTARANPSMQLLNLRIAFNYLNKLDLQLDTPRLEGFDEHQIYFDYFQQLYVFARNDSNAMVKGIMPLKRYLLMTSFLAQAYNGLEKVSNLPSATEWINDALFSLKGNLHKINTLLHNSLTNLVPSASEEWYQNLILYGANGLPLSIGQRKTILNILKTKIPDNAISESLATKNYEQSPYHIAAQKEDKSFSNNYYHMLFMLDVGDFKPALKLAQKLSIQHKDFRGETFSKNILLQYCEHFLRIF